MYQHHIVRYPRHGTALSYSIKLRYRPPARTMSCSAMFCFWLKVTLSGISGPCALTRAMTKVEDSRERRP
jgi:hypothetical protein